jgi:hypothetical protein
MKTVTLTLSVACPDHVDPMTVLTGFIEAGVEQARARHQDDNADEEATAAISCTWGNVTGWALSLKSTYNER